MRERKNFCCFPREEREGEREGVGESERCWCGGLVGGRGGGGGGKGDAEREAGAGV